ncbi:MAG: NAD(P)-binding protein, partial [Pseudomonadota bacterium]
IAVALEAMRQGMTNIIILEKADDVGGTWRENTYPGVACDVPSHLYCLANHPNPNWSDFYASGHEIQNYLKVVAQSEGIYENDDVCHSLTHSLQCNCDATEPGSDNQQIGLDRIFGWHEVLGFRRGT